MEVDLKAWHRIVARRDYRKSPRASDAFSRCAPHRQQTSKQPQNCSLRTKLTLLHGAQVSLVHHVAVMFVPVVSPSLLHVVVAKFKKSVIDDGRSQFLG
jgi:hypothetical protein